MKSLLVSLLLIPNASAPTKVILAPENALAKALFEVLPPSTDEHPSFALSWTETKKVLIVSGENLGGDLISCSKHIFNGRAGKSVSFKGCTIETVAEAPADIISTTLIDLMLKAGGTAE